MTDISKRILEIKNAQGINDHQLEVGADLPPASTRVWRNGRKNLKGELKEINPSAESIVKVARFLNVSADYLLCLTDDPTPLDKNLPTTRSNTSLSPLETELGALMQENTFINTTKLYKLMSDIEKGMLFGFALDIIKRKGIDTRAIVGY